VELLQTAEPTEIANRYGVLSNLTESTVRGAETTTQKIVRRPRINTNNMKINMKRGANFSHSKHHTKYCISKASATTYNGDADESVNNQDSDSDIEPKCISVIVTGRIGSYIKGERNSYKNGEMTCTRNLISELQVKLINSKKSLTKSSKHKILLIGNSRLRGYAANIILFLNDLFEVSGTIKPGANSETILEQVISEIGKLSPKDTVILCCGTNYIGRVDLREVLKDVISLIRKVSHTNLIMLTVPYRHDLRASDTRINDKIKSVNRKLHKLAKFFSYRSILEVDTERYLFTKRGLI
jgi:hypothetical protein